MLYLLVRSELVRLLEQMIIAGPPPTAIVYSLKNPGVVFSSLISACNGLKVTLIALLKVLLEGKVDSYLPSYRQHRIPERNPLLRYENACENWKMNPVVCSERLFT